MLEDNHYFILLKNIIFSRVSFIPELDYALSIMIENGNFNKIFLWLVSLLGIEIASFVNYFLGFLIYLLFNRFDRLENTTYVSMKQKFNKLILVLILILSSCSNGGGAIATLISGFFRFDIKKILIITLFAGILNLSIRLLI